MSFADLIPRLRRPLPLLLTAILFAVALDVRGQDVPAKPLSRFHVGGFADIEWHTSSESTREGLDLAELDVFSSLQLSQAWSGFGEGVLRGSWSHSEKAVEADLERLYAEYSTSDALRIEIGETSTGVVHWNEREHRSRFLQTPIDVPAIARRPKDDGAWPLHFAGLVASGRLSGPWGVGWAAGVGAGPGRIRDTTPLTAKDRSPASLISLTTSPDRIPGLELAASAYAGHVRTDAGRMRENDVSFAVNYATRGNEIRGEWSRMNHHFGGRTYRSTGYYALFSKRLSGVAERIRPYLMFDRATIAKGEAYLADATDENAWSAGVRYDVTPHFTIKGEYRSDRAVTGDRENVIGIQFGLSF